MKLHFWTLLALYSFSGTLADGDAEPKPTPDKPLVFPAQVIEGNHVLKSITVARDVFITMTEVDGGIVGGAAVWIGLATLALEEGAEAYGLITNLIIVGGAFCLAVGVVFLVVAFFLAAAGWIWGHGEDTVTPARMAMFARPLSLDDQQKEACATAHQLSTGADGTAKDVFGLADWNEMFDNFGPFFEAAQDVAHRRVTDHIIGAETQVWPTLPPLPVPHHNATPDQKKVYDRDLQVWVQNNILIIPKERQKTELFYSDLHFVETFESVYINEHPLYPAHSEEYNSLVLSFLYHVSLPLYCFGDGVSERPDMIHKLSGLRNNTMIREARVKHLTELQFDARTVMTKAQEHL